MRVSRILAVFWRAEGLGHWSLECPPFEDEAAAEKRRAWVVGLTRGRYRVTEAMVLEFPGRADVPIFIPVGKEKDAVPAVASRTLVAVPSGKDSQKPRAAGKSATRATA